MTPADEECVFSSSRSIVILRRRRMSISEILFPVYCIADSEGESGISFATLSRG